MATIVFVTYTFAEPAMFGVFFRAVRLGAALADRGHRVVVANMGPIPADPKVESVRGRVEGWQVPAPAPGADTTELETFLSNLAPDLYVSGEGPLGALAVWLGTAGRLGIPTVILEQYYQGWMVRQWPDHGERALLLYGLDWQWRLDPPGMDRAARLPPMIDAVTMPESPPSIVALARDRRVFDGLLDLLVRLGPVDTLAIVRDPEEAAAAAAARGVTGIRFSGPVPDDELFGMIAAAAVAVVANGYMQIVECLALATPVVALARDGGLPRELLSPLLLPFVSFDGGDEGARRVRQWLAADPFPAEVRAELVADRGGVGVAVRLLEAWARE